MYHLKVTVEEIKGFCDLPMEEGDYLEVKGGKIILPDNEYFCLWALQSLMPFLPAKQRETKEENDWIPKTKRLSCPDPNGRVIFRVDRIDPKTGKIVEDYEDLEPPARLLVDEEACSGCRACEIACSFEHQEDFSSKFSRIRVEKDEPEGIDRPYVCRQCGGAECVKACPTDALSRDPETHAVLLDEEKCIGCKECEEACPFDGIFTDKDTGKPLICDLCGGEPLCVKRCPTEALQFGNAENHSRGG